MRDLVEWLANSAPREPHGRDGETAASFAAGALTRLRARLKKQGRHLRKLDDSDLHELRITAKKLRYAGWFFAGLFPGDKPAKRARRFIDAMRALQDRLGEIQDVAVAPATLERLHVPRANWPALPNRARLVKRAATDLDRALACKPYWR